MSSWYTAISGVNAATVNLDTTAHNIANASTTGFKNSRAEFGDMVAGSNGIGVQTEAVNQFFQQGGIIPTGHDNLQVDLAVSGNGFFKVIDSSGVERYTRYGADIHVDADGKVVNGMNQQLVGSDGSPLAFDKTSLPLNTFTIDAKGNIIAIDKSGNPVSPTAGVSIGLANFPNVQGLKAVGDTDWIATTASGTATFGTVGSNGTGNLVSGALEASNVDLTAQLVNMIIAQRDFTANAKTITTNDAITQVAVNISR